MKIKRKKISELGEVITGKTPSKNLSKPFGDKLQFFTPSDIQNQRYLEKTQRCLSEESIEKLNKYVLPKNTILVTCIGSDMGKVCITRSEGISNQQINAIIPNKENDYLFIYYLLKTKKNYLRNYASGGSTMPIINKNDFSNLEFNIPPLPTQINISSFLSSLDKKIELNQKMNATLEEIAKILFKSWFIDFNPVRAKAEGKPTGLSKEISDLFPDSFEDSELGEIPKGWKVVELESCIDVLGGHAFKSKDYIENGIFVLRTKNFIDGVARFENDDVFLPERFLESHKSFICEEFDYHLVMVGASIGKTGIIYPSMLPALRNQNMWCFRPRESKYSRVFVKHTVDFVSKKLIRYASGSARDFFRKGDFRSNKLVIPSDEILISFSSITDPILNKQATNFKENETLIELRDTLLPKLISGELKIPDAESLIEEASI